MAEYMTNLTDLTVEDLTVTGTSTITGATAITGAITATGGVSYPTTAKSQYRDSAIYINSSVDGQMDIVADAEVQIATTLVDLNGNLDVSGTTAIGDTVTWATDKKAQFRDNGCFIHSVSDGKILYSADGTGADNHTFAGTVTFNDEATFSDDITAGFINVEEITESRVHYKHDFDEIGAVLASTSMAYYYTGGGTSGTQTIAAAECGEMQLSTTATGSRSSTLIYAGSIVADNDKEWEFKTRVKLNDITNTKMECGMYVDANDEIVFRFDTALDAANIYLVTESNNAGEVVTDTTVDLVVGEWIEFSIEVAADDTFEVFINGTEVLNVHTSNVIRDVAFKPWFYVDNKAAAEEKILSIDYVEFSQNRTV